MLPAHFQAKVAPSTKGEGSAVNRRNAPVENSRIVSVVESPSRYLPVRSSVENLMRLRSW